MFKGWVPSISSDQGVCHKENLLSVCLMRLVSEVSVTVALVLMKAWIRFNCCFLTGPLYAQRLGEANPNQTKVFAENNLL